MVDRGGEGEEEGEADGVFGASGDIAMDLVEEGEDVDGGGVDVVDGGDVDGVSVVNTAILADELKGVKIDFQGAVVAGIPCRINTYRIAIFVEEKDCTL